MPHRHNMPRKIYTDAERTEAQRAYKAEYYQRNKARINARVAERRAAQNAQLDAAIAADDRAWERAHAADNANLIAGGPIAPHATMNAVHPHAIHTAS